MLNLFKSQIVIDTESYCNAHNVHPDNAKLMLKIARNLPRHTSCTAEDIASKLCIGIVTDDKTQDSIYGSRNANR